MKNTTVGPYAPWLWRIAGKGPGAWSLRNRRFRSLAAWKAGARRLALDRLAPPDSGSRPRARVVRRETVDGVAVEHLRWRLPYGPPTDAVFLKPEGATGKLPGVLALHSHGGNKILGWRKVARGGEAVHPIVSQHVALYNGGRWWANELAKRGYAVLAPDGFPFGSRRVRPGEVHPRVRGDAPAREPRTVAEIWRYNHWAGGHEHVMAKALFDAGTTWPGVVLAEDQRALDVLCARPEVDPARVGCGGLSGGGTRTVLLGGLDPRIKAAVCVGFMSTWRDFAVKTCWTHAWMSHVPLLAADMEFSELLGLRVPLPTLVLNTTRDQLFTQSEVRRADRVLKAVYRKAGAPERYRASFHPGPHKFDVPMQEEAFAFFDRWLA